MVHWLTKKIVKDTPVYLATAAGKKHYNKIFPNDTERNPYCRAEKFLGHYSDWTGTGSNGKWEELAEKLGHYPDYEKNSHNYGTSYVKTARGQLRIKADDQDALLQAQAQLPTSNNDLAAAAAAASQPTGSTAPRIAPTNHKHLGQKAQARDDNEVSFKEDDDSDAKVPYPYLPKKGGDRANNQEVKCSFKVEDGKHFIEILDSESDSDDEDVKIIDDQGEKNAPSETWDGNNVEKVAGKPIVPANVKKEKNTAGIADEEAMKEKVLGIGEVDEEEKKEEDKVDIALYMTERQKYRDPKKKYEDLKEKYNAVRSNNEQLRKQSAIESKARDEEVESLRTEMETIVADEQKVNETNTRLRAEIMQLTEEHNAARINNEELRKQSAIESKARDQEVESLRKEMETSVAEKQQAAETNTRLQAEIMQLTEERDKLGEESRKWENLYNTLKTKANAELAKSQSALVELHVEHKNLQDKYINDMNILASLKKTVKKMKDKMAESEETLEYMRADVDDLDCNFQLLDRRFQENEEDNEVFQENANERFDGIETNVNNIGNDLEDVQNDHANLQDEVDEVKVQANITSNDVCDLQMAQAQAASAEGAEEEEEEDDDEDDDDGDSQTPQGVPASDEIVASLLTYVLDESGGDNSDSSQQESSHSQQDSSDNEQSADLLSSVPWHDVSD